mmetsp:Transcript_22388/g.55968  ORF Transcript_22388/g.55968 Transcript_22388/m.55968 type:complete len:227 (-) Transcript_22388:158-838(-)
MPAKDLLEAVHDLARRRQLVDADRWVVNAQELCQVECVRLARSICVEVENVAAGDAGEVEDRVDRAHSVNGLAVIRTVPGSGLCDFPSSHREVLCSVPVCDIRIAHASQVSQCHSRARVTLRRALLTYTAPNAVGTCAQASQLASIRKAPIIMHVGQQQTIWPFVRLRFWHPGLPGAAVHEVSEASSPHLELLRQIDAHWLFNHDSDWADLFVQCGEPLYNIQEQL